MDPLEAVQGSLADEGGSWNFAFPAFKNRRIPNYIQRGLPRARKPIKIALREGEEANKKEVQARLHI